MRVGRLYLITPTLQIRAGWGALGNAVDDLGGVELMITKSRDCVGAGVVAVPAVLGAGFVVDFAGVKGVLRCLEEIVDQVDGVI